MSGGPDLSELAGQGVAVIVGTADAARMPAVARGWGSALDEDASRLALCVVAPRGSPTRANLVLGSTVAVTLSRPTSYQSVQVKGPLRALGPPDEEALRRAHEHVEAFAAETSAIGVPDVVIRATLGTEWLAITLDVAERYDQTPGPGARRAL